MVQGSVSPEREVGWLYPEGLEPVAAGWPRAPAHPMCLAHWGCPRGTFIRESGS